MSLELARRIPMSNWQEVYRSRVKTADEAVKAVSSGNRLFLTGNASVPLTLLDALVRRAPELEDVEICHVLTFGSTAYAAPEMAGHLRVNSMFISANVRQAVNEGRGDFTPVLLSEMPLLFKNGLLPLDLAFIHVSPPDEEGYCSLGTEPGPTITAAESARIVIAQVNRQMPRTLGDTRMHVEQLHHIVEVDEPICEHAMGQKGDEAVIQEIAGHIAGLIPDGATMQLGIGALPDAVLKHLYNKKDLGIHTELFSDGVIDLVEAGVITNARKTLHPGKIIAGFLLGTKRLYDWVDNNPLVEFYRTEYVNDPFVVAQNDRMVAINSALEVDLTGQICADSIGPRMYSAVGGQLDFVYGASRSKGGVPIITLPSTAQLRDGTVVSKIVPMLKQGAGVVTTRNHVHYVVTEFGVAALYGKTVRQRAQALINIAHPRFRDEMTAQARELHYL
ncbi:acetyl-CoA hydrolase/transferase family protein [Geobacter argillaceus]|uniref:Acetyl-CoA hydrolase n=1 Tax=Geobacter argillaceus TaxID=345631 RepID=A0A562VHG2_9BACT|nr:acetyl-CoA hydrolase/transferase C-terminal domain-containing protein [Geobacter argillaceus]TWJ17355.1 acetyl-CoA hydrolase [Geobacter argillaceus]